MERKFHPILDYKDGICDGYTGQINFKQPELSIFSIDDIACGLSKICRFGGQIHDFYTVAQHSVLVMHLAPPELKKEALMHDAAEAFLGDVVKPLKHLIGDKYEELENKFTKVICDRFGLNAHKLHILTKQYDIQALKLESEALQKRNAIPLMIEMNKHEMIDGGEFFAWTHGQARFEFMSAYRKAFNIPIR